MGSWLREGTALLLLLGCGSSVRPDDDADAGAGTGGTAGAASAPLCPSGTSSHTDGTRVRGRYAVTEDGARAWLAWHDTKLDVDCVFVPFTDGTHRCVPYDYRVSWQFFTDPGCTEAAYTAGPEPSCTPIDYIVRFESGDCSGAPPSGFRWYEVAEAVPASSERYQLFADGTCAPGTPPVAEFFRRGPEVDTDHFAAATYGPLSDGGRVQGYGYTGSDGLRELVGWVDTELDTNCSFERAADGQRRCLPQTTILDEFADAACGTPLLELGSCADDSAVYARIKDGNCRAAGAVTLVTGARFDDQVYTGSRDACFPATSDGKYYFAVPVPLETFQRIDESFDEGVPGRLKPRFATTPDDGCWADDYWDAELETMCSFGLASDGRQRCLPGPYNHDFNSLYSDDACTEAVAYAGPFDCGSVPVERFAFSFDFSNDCASPADVWRMGEPISSDELPALWQGREADCLPAYLPSGHYAPLTAMTPTDFVAGEVVVE